MTSVADDRATAAAVARPSAPGAVAESTSSIAASPRTMQHTPASLLTHRIAGSAPASDLARAATERWVTDGGAPAAAYPAATDESPPDHR